MRPFSWDYAGTSNVGQEILHPVEDDRVRWWARKLDSAVDHHRYLAEPDLDGLQAFSLDLVRRVKQSMAKENFCV